MRAWAAALILVTAPGSLAQDAEADNPLLARLYALDQADDERNAVDVGGGLPTAEMLARFPPELAEDVRRLLSVDSVRVAGGVRTANDHYHAAMVYQHAADTTSYRLAAELSRRAVELDPDHADARWLSAAAQDRYLVAAGRRQWYGTQYGCDEEGLRVLEPVEEGRVTDSEREALGVQTLAESRAREGTPCGS